MVPAPALPAWPPPTSPGAASWSGGAATSQAAPWAAPSGRPSASAAHAGGPSRRDGSADGRPGRFDGGPDLGTLYGGTEGPGFATVALPTNPAMENSGSLTGHILAQGWAASPAEERSSTARVVIVLTAALALLMAISVLVVLLAGDVLDGLVGGILNT
ncbi:hypothetical protein JD76_04736 [Micromonospora endolithica]|nr:hypothetical protein JD76_04736 [Micromonospora endolithica]